MDPPRCGRDAGFRVSRPWLRDSHRGGVLPRRRPRPRSPVPNVTARLAVGVARLSPLVPSPRQRGGNGRRAAAVGPRRRGRRCVRSVASGGESAVRGFVSALRAIFVEADATMTAVAAAAATAAVRGGGTGAPRTAAVSSTHPLPPSRRQVLHPAYFPRPNLVVSWRPAPWRSTLYCSSAACADTRARSVRGCSNIHDGNRPAAPRRVTPHAFHGPVPATRTCICAAGTLARGACGQRAPCPRHGDSGTTVAGLEDGGRDCCRRPLALHPYGVCVGRSRGGATVSSR